MELLHFRGIGGWDMYSFFLAEKVYTLSIESYSNVKKDVLSEGGAVQEDCFNAAIDEHQPHRNTSQSPADTSRKQSARKLE